MRKLTMIAGFLAVTMACGTVFADRDEVGFAKALASAGYFDHANDICNRLEQKAQLPNSPIKLNDIVLIRAAIKKAEGDIKLRSGKTAEAMPVLNEAIGLFEKYLADPGVMATKNKKLYETLFDIGDLYSTMGGESYNTLFKGATIAAEKEAYRNDSNNYYGKAREYYQRICEDLKKDDDATGNEESDLYRLYMQARYLSMEALFLHSKIFPEGDPNINSLCEACLKDVDEFIWDYENYAVAYEAIIIQAMCNYQLGKPDKALSQINSVIFLKDGDDTKYQESCKDIIVKAYRNKVDYLMQKTEKDPNFHKEILKVVDEMNAYVKDAAKYYPDFPSDETVILVNIDRIKSRFTIGGDEFDKGVAEANKIGDINPRWKRVISKLLVGDTGGSGGIQDKMAEMPPSVLQKMVEGSFSTNKYDDAIKFAQAILKKPMKDEEKKIYLPFAYKQLAKVYETQGYYYEAAVCLEMVYKNYKSRFKMDVDEEIYAAVRNFTRENALMENNYDKSRAERLLKNLVSEYPKSKYTKNAKYIIGISEMDKKEYLKAAKTFSIVDPDAEAYEDALINVGFCYYLNVKQGLKKDLTPEEIKDSFDKAISAYNAYYEYAKKNQPVNSREADARKGRIFNCNYYLATVYIEETVGKASDALELLKNTEKDFPNDADKISKAWLKMVEAYMRIGDWTNAKSTLDTAKAKYPDAQKLAYTLKLAGSMFDDSGSQALKAKPDDMVAKQMVIDGRSYLFEWLSSAFKKGDTVKTEELLSFGDRFLLVADLMTDPAQKKVQLGRANDVYNLLFKRNELDPKQTIDLKLKVAESNVKMANYPEARKMLEALLKQLPKEGRVILGLITTYVQEARESGLVNKDVLVEALNLIDKVLRSVTYEKDPGLWWEMKVSAAEIRFLMGDYQPAMASLKMSLYGREVPAEIKTRVDKLIKDLKEKGIWK